MATKFLEPGGDANFSAAYTNGFWNATNAFTLPTIVSDFVHGSHVKSIKYAPNVQQAVRTPVVLSDAGSRISFYIYLNALPTALSNTGVIYNNSLQAVVVIKLTSAGVLQLFESTNQIGSNGPTLATGVWYRISLAYTISSTTVNRFEVYVDGVSAISVTNATLSFVSSTILGIGNFSTDTTLDFRSSDHYIDDSSSLTDPGNIWVTAKRPVSNGSANNFTTQIGAGGSGYGSGHSPQVNERPLSTTNGWSMIGAGSAVTEEYTIEGKSVGDIDISAMTIIDFLGWVSASSVTNETASIIVAGATSNISLTSTIALFTKIAGSSTYPAGGTDIGIVTSTTVTTVGLYECGIIVAYTPTVTAVPSGSKMLIGFGF